MNRLMTRLVVVVMVAAPAHASIPVMITQQDRTTVPFSLESALNRDGHLAQTWGSFHLDVNGVSTVVRLDRIAHAHLARPGRRAAGRFTQRGVGAGSPVLQGGEG